MTHLGHRRLKNRDTGEVELVYRPVQTGVGYRPHAIIEDALRAACEFGVNLDGGTYRLQALAVNNNVNATKENRFLWMDITLISFERRYHEGQSSADQDS